MPKARSELTHERIEELPPQLRELRPFVDIERDHKFLKKNYASIEARYPGEWVAILDSRVVAHAKRNSDFWSDLRRKKLDRQSPVTFFVTAPIVDNN
jgi:hypothetical protein